jgi:hypothetical protein
MPGVDPKTNEAARKPPLECRCVDSLSRGVIVALLRLGCSMRSLPFPVKGEAKHPSPSDGIQLPAISCQEFWGARGRKSLRCASNSVFILESQLKCGRNSPNKTECV